MYMCLISEIPNLLSQLLSRPQKMSGNSAQEKDGGFEFSMVPFFPPLADRTTVLIGSVYPELGQ